MRKYLTMLFLTYLCGVSLALSTRSLGMGDAYPLTARDPSGIFYNPAYLAKADGVRVSLDNIAGSVLPRNNIALSIGDLGIACNSDTRGPIYYIAQAFNTYSFLHLGIGAKFSDTQRNVDIGLDADITKNLAVSAALLNEKDINFSSALKTEDGDKCLVASYGPNGNLKLGYENQFSDKAFWRLGYNVDHPSAGLTLPAGPYIDFDLAADFAGENTKILWGINLFRNTENKRVNSNHSINFGKAIVGEDKFITIEGFNIHYVDTGFSRDTLSLWKRGTTSAPTGEGFQPRTLVLLGGGIHFTHHWDPYMKQLAQKFRVINIDQLGAGESDKPDYFFGYTVAEQAELINELLNRIGIKEAYLLGYCYGGSIAFYLAGHYPERYKRLVIIEGFVRGINTIPISDKLRPGALKMRHDVEYLNAYLLRDFITWHYRLLYPYFNSKMWYQLNKDVLYADLREDIRNLKAPVLYYAGTKSWAYEFLGPTKDYIKENIKDLKFIEIEGAGHDVDRFDQTEFLRQVFEFLD